MHAHALFGPKCSQRPAVSAPCCLDVEEVQKSGHVESSFLVRMTSFEGLCGFHEPFCRKFRFRTECVHYLGDNYEEGRIILPHRVL